MLLDGMKTLVRSIGPVAVRLGVYNFGAGNEPGVFTTVPAPVDAPAPLITIAVDRAEPFATRGNRGQVWNFTVTLWGDRLMTEKALEKIAMDLWSGLDRAQLTVSGYGGVLLNATGPVKLNADPDGFPGYVVTAEATLLED